MHIAGKLRPKGHQVVIRKIVETKTRGGIILADSAQGKNPVDQAEVIAVGPGVVSQYTGQRIDIDVKVAEKVLVPRFCGTEIDVNGEKLHIIPAPEIISGVDEGKA